MTVLAHDYRIMRGEPLRFVVQPLDADGQPIDTSGLEWIAVLDAVGPTGLPVRYALVTERVEDEPGVIVTLGSALSRALSTLSTYVVSSDDLEGNVTPRAYGSVVVQGPDPGGPVPSEPDAEYASPHYVADEVISPLSVVRMTDDGERVAVARMPEPEALAPIGIATQAAQAGGSVTVRSSGPVSDPTWNWIPGRPVLLGAGGALTQDQPLGMTHLVVIGYALDADTILIRIGLPIQLAD